MPDKDGYPTPAELRRVRTFRVIPEEGPSQFIAFMDYVRSAWWHPDWGWRKAQRRHRDRPGSRLYRRYDVSTGGWSGNEDIISAMQKNWAFWAICWVESRRGGHFIFHVPEND